MVSQSKVDVTGHDTVSRIDVSHHECIVRGEEIVRPSTQPLSISLGLYAEAASGFASWGHALFGFIWGDSTPTFAEASDSTDED